MSSQLDHFEYLSNLETEQIIQQLYSPAFAPNRQVLWSGLQREEAQRWADEHDLQTLTTVMGPLMRPEHISCVKSKKSSKGWTNYVKGASMLFAQRIAEGESVTVLCAPPPEKLHPSGLTNYQTLEEPILKRLSGNNHRLVINMCHPTVPGAEEYCYKAWPEDNTRNWVEKYGTVEFKSRGWRPVRSKASPAAREPKFVGSASICCTVKAVVDQGTEPHHSLAVNQDGTIPKARVSSANQTVDIAMQGTTNAALKSVKASRMVNEATKLFDHDRNKTVGQANKAARKAGEAVKKASKATEKASKAAGKANKAAGKADKAAGKADKAAGKASKANRKADDAARKATGKANKGKPKEHLKNC